VIVEAVHQMVRTLGLRIVAEGVETEPQLERLRGLGCDLAQGWLIGPPLPAPERVGPSHDLDARTRPARHPARR